MGRSCKKRHRGSEGKERRKRVAPRSVVDHEARQLAYLRIWTGPSGSRPSAGKGNRTSLGAQKERQRVADSLLLEIVEVQRGVHRGTVGPQRVSREGARQQELTLLATPLYSIRRSS